MTVGNLSTYFADKKPLAIAFIVFMLYYMPCIPSINTICTEGNGKYALLNVGISFATAYILGALVY
ncbi:MAG: hypothetical protein MJ223_01705 [Mycoplasmoidaceae bacterium]|nr:hypothetical protein [Mycoplasmoidaceae bacterium]